MSSAEFLKELPSRNSDNFSRFQPDSRSFKNSVKKPSVYLCTKDSPEEQIITNEKTNILIRYLKNQALRKRIGKSLCTFPDAESTPSKRVRLQEQDDEDDETDSF